MMTMMLMTMITIMTTMIFLLQRHTSDFSIRDRPPPKKKNPSYIVEVNCPTQPNCIAHFDLSIYHVVFQRVHNEKYERHAAVNPPTYKMNFRREGWLFKVSKELIKTKF